MNSRSSIFPLLLLILIAGLFLNAHAASLNSGIADHVEQEPAAPGQPLSATPCVAGMAGPYPCNKIDLLKFLPINSIGCTGNGNVVEGWTDPLDGMEYALMGCDNGTSFIDVSDPINPVYLGRLPAHNGSNSLWRDIRVYNNHALVGSEAAGHGIQVFDLTQLRNVPSPPQVFTETAHYNKLGNSHTIFVNNDSGFLYAVGSGGGSNTCQQTLHMINIQNPATPTFAGCFKPTIYTHETTCLTYHGPDTTYQGNEICFNADGPSEDLTIANVTNKGSPVEIARVGYPGSNYPHQVWLTEDHRYLLLDDELDESSFGHNTKTYIWNVSNLDAPVLIGAHTHATTSIDHNQYIKGNFVYQSNYTAGLRILDLTNVASASLAEVAYFDIWPANNSAVFEGTWDNYPFFISGIVLVSGIFGANTAGLFILQPTINPDFQISSGPAVLACTPGSGNANVDLLGLFGYTGNVILSTNGLPAGATSSFNPNPVAPPGSSTMTITVSGTPAGSYPFNIHGTDGTISHDKPTTFNVSDNIPGNTTLTTPADGSIDQDFIVNFVWTAASQAATYSLEVAADPAFSNIFYSNVVATTSHTATTVFNPSTTYYWRIRPSNACGTGADSATFDFTTRAPGEVLLVDDDNNLPDMRSYYTNALNALSTTYDIWDTANDLENHDSRLSHINEPDSLTLSHYPAVVWFSGDASGGSADPHAGPSPFGETQLSTYLDAGGCLVLSSEEYFNDVSDTVTSFMANYLGISSVNDNVFQTSVTGAGSVFSGVGNFALSFPAGISNLSDRITPIVASGVEVAFTGNQGNAAVNKNSGIYRTIFLGFPFETIASPTGRNNVLSKAMTYCAGTGCPTIVVDPPSLPGGTVGAAYNQTITASGGAAPYTFAVTSGALPGGLILSAGGTLSGTPTTAGSFAFVITATDSVDCTGTRSYNIVVNPITCLFCDDFEDGQLAANWTYLKPLWTESGGNLISAPSNKKAIAVATPAFAGCQNCNVTASLMSAGGNGNKVWLLAWYVDKQNTIELLMSEEQNRWILKHRVNGAVVAKGKANSIIDPNVSYNVQLNYNGTQLQLVVDGAILITLSPISLPPGTVGFQSKNTTGSSGGISVN